MKYVLKFVQWLKKFLFEVPNSSKQNIGDADMRTKPEPPPLPPLTAYEERRKDIAESTEPIEGIFYLHDNKVIPDYYTECLFTDKDNPIREEMYHTHFYPDYMQRKYNGLPRGEKSLPRGRISGIAADPVIYIDKCYESNTDIINQVIELYRLPESVTLMPNPMYRCPSCYFIK